MEIANNQQNCTDMESLCNSARTYIMAGNYESGMELICQFMEQYPHAPQPHNLLGIVMEKTGKHHAAMKHFKAALALDPEYLPAKYNLRTYGTFFSRGCCAFDESDITIGESGNIEVVYDSRNIGHAVYQNRIEYDEHGIGHVVRK